jgi:hypothetical protein
MLISHELPLVSISNSSKTSGCAIISSRETPAESLMMVISAGVDKIKLVVLPSGLKNSCLGPSSLLHRFPQDAEANERMKTDQNIFLVTTIANIVDETTNSW